MHPDSLGRGNDSLHIWIETTLHQDTLHIDGRFTGSVETDAPLDYTLSVSLERTGGTSSSSQQGRILPGAFESKHLSRTSQSFSDGDNAIIILRLEKDGTFLQADTVYYPIR